MRLTIKNISGVLWIGSSQVVLLLSNLILLKFLTSDLTVADFGYYSLCVSVVLFIRQIIYDPFSMVVGKYFASNFSNKYILSQAFRVVGRVVDGFGAVVIFIAIVFFIGETFFYAGNNFSIIAICCSIYLIANGAQGVYLNIFNSTGERKSAAIFSIIDSILKFTLTIFILNIFKDGLINALESLSFGAALTFISIRYFVRQKIVEGELNSIDVKNNGENFLLACLPLYLPSLLTALKSVGDRWVLSAFMGIDQLAAYSVLLQIGYFPVILLAGVAQTYMGPTVYKMCNRQIGIDYLGLRRLLLTVLSMMAVILCLAAGISHVLAYWIFDIFVGPKYKEFSGYLSFFVIAGSFGAGAGILQLIVFGFFDTKTSAKLISISIALGLMFVFLMIYLFGFLGAIGGLIFLGVTPIILFGFTLYKELGELHG